MFNTITHEDKKRVFEELAYAKFEAFKDDPLFKKFMFTVIKEEVHNIMRFAEDDNRSLTYEEAFHYFLFQELKCERKNVRDFFCQMYNERFYPAEYMPLVFSYDAYRQTM